MDYQKQADDFLKKAETTFTIKLLGHFPYFENDKQARDVYQVTLARGKKKYSFRFGQSVAHSSKPEQDKTYWSIHDHIRENKEVQAPSAYDVLATITKDDPGTFSDFCSNFGYDTDSRRAEKNYFVVQEEYKNIFNLFSDVMEDLAEIQ